jgi:hypothetical protein
MYIEACGEEMSRVSHYWNRGTDVRLGTAPLISKGGLTLLSGGSMLYPISHDRRLEPRPASQSAPHRSPTNYL